MSNIDWSKYEQPPQDFNWDDFSQPPEDNKKTTIGSDVKKQFMNAPEDALNMLASILSDAQKSASQIKKDPVRAVPRAVGKTGSGILEGFKGAYNLPLKMGQYLGEKDIPGFKQLLPLYRNLQVGDTGLEKAVFGENKPGDNFFEGVGQVTPFGLGAKGAPLIEKAFRMALMGLSQDQNPVATSLLGIAPDASGKAVKAARRPFKNRKELKEIESQLDSADAEKSLSEEQLNLLKDSLAQQFGIESPKALKRDIVKSQQKTQELEPLLDIPEQDFSKALPPATGESILPEAKTKIEQAKQPIKEVLDDVESHDVDAAKIIKATMKENRDRIGQDYDKLQEDLSQKNIKLSNSKTASQIMNEIKEVISKSPDSIRSEEAINLAKQLEEVGKDTIVSADKFMDSFRSANKLANKIESTAYEPGITQEEFSQRQGQANYFREKADQMKNVLEKGVGEKYLTRLQNINKEYATQVAPLHKNKIAKDAKYKGRIDSANIIKELRGDAPGQSQLNKMISENPKLLHSILGQRFAENPENLLNPTKLEKKYIDQSKELKPLVEELKKAVENMDKASQKKKFIESEKQRIDKSYEIDAKTQRQRKEAISEYERLTKDIQEKQQALDQLNNRIKNHQGTELKLKELKGKKKAKEAELRNTKNKIRKTINLLLKLGGLKYYFGNLI